ncbi:LIM domain-containing protein [Phthorimaea operculella]|nr:LIM domain-containing protein [Phthorimaea operculella]
MPGNRACSCGGRRADSAPTVKLAASTLTMNPHYHGYAELSSPHPPSPEAAFSTNGHDYPHNNNNPALKECAGCGGKIVERFLLHALDRYWHHGCLKCACCAQALADMGRSFYFKGGMILCKSDYTSARKIMNPHYHGYAELSSPHPPSPEAAFSTNGHDYPHNNNNPALKECAGCGGKIVERFLLHALDRYWHHGCLKCACCAQALADMGRSFYFKGGMILCKSDYTSAHKTMNPHYHGYAELSSPHPPSPEAAFSTNGHDYPHNNNNPALKECAGCGGKIVERFLLHALDRYWHHGCLKCACCAQALADMGRSFYFKGGMILCKSDYTSSCNQITQVALVSPRGPQLPAGASQLISDAHPAN